MLSERESAMPFRIRTLISVLIDLSNSFKWKLVSSLNLSRKLRIQPANRGHRADYI
jgi:hypothetical protein